MTISAIRPAVALEGPGRPTRDHRRNRFVITWSVLAGTVRVSEVGMRVPSICFDKAALGLDPKHARSTPHSGRNDDVVDQLLHDLPVAPGILESSGGPAEARQSDSIACLKNALGSSSEPTSSSMVLWIRSSDSMRSWKRPSLKSPGVTTWPNSGPVEMFSPSMTRSRATRLGC